MTLELKLQDKIDMPGNPSHLQDLDVDEEGNIWTITNYVTETYRKEPVVVLDDSLNIKILPLRHHFRELANPWSIHVKNDWVYVGDSGDVSSQGSTVVYDKKTCRRIGEIEEARGLQPERIKTIGDDFYIFHSGPYGKDSAHKGRLFYIQHGHTPKNIVEKNVRDIASKGNSLYALQFVLSSEPDECSYKVIEIVNGQIKNETVINDELFECFTVNDNGDLFLLRNGYSHPSEKLAELHAYSGNGEKIGSEELDLLRVNCIGFDNNSRLILCGNLHSKNEYGKDIYTYPLHRYTVELNN